MQIRVAVVNGSEGIKPCAFDQSIPCPQGPGPEAELSNFIIRNLLDVPNRAEIDIKFVPATGYQGTDPSTVLNLLKNNMADMGPPTMALLSHRAATFPNIGALYRGGTALIYKTVTAHSPNLAMFELVQSEILITVLLFGILFKLVRFFGKKYGIFPSNFQKKENVNFRSTYKLI